MKFKNKEHQQQKTQTLCGVMGKNVNSEDRLSRLKSPFCHNCLGYSGKVA